MKKKVLITGGAGFIGSHLADELLRNGYSVRVLDVLSPQMHEDNGQRPSYLAPEVELIKADVRNADVVSLALNGIDVVYHFAAAVGVGQSMYKIANYTSTNTDGTAVLLEALATNPVERLIVASSMSIYGEGIYRDSRGNQVSPNERTLDQLEARRWDLFDADGEQLHPMPTPESKRPGVPSVYALSKYYQERMCLTIGKAYAIPTVALRFFNVYGTRQSLSNPYTGVVAIFASRLLNNQPPLINEDGQQKRDFVSVHDVANACRLALEVSQAADQVFNVGSGRAVTIASVAQTLAKMLGKKRLKPDITSRYRKGDVRHCFADIALARNVLGYDPKVSFESGMEELVEWLAGKTAMDRGDEAHAELIARGLAA
jgi:dTDP-L-rhamnose 4-epimerase